MLQIDEASFRISGFLQRGVDPAPGRFSEGLEEDGLAPVATGGG